MGCRSYLSCKACASVNSTEAGIISAWDFKPLAGTIPDLVSDNDGTQQPKTVVDNDKISDGMYFAGGAIPIGDKSDFKRDTFTISCLLRPDSTSATQAVFSLSSGDHYYVGVTTTGRLIFSTATAAGIANVLYSSNNAVVTNLTTHVVFTANTVGSTVTKRIYANSVLVGESIDTDGWYTNYGSSGFFIGGFNATTSLLNGKISCLKFYSDQKEQAWVNDEYRMFKKGMFRLFKVVDTDYYSSGQIPYTPIYVKSGGVRINDSLVQTNSTSIYYVPGGYISYNNKQNAYGRWRFDFKKISLVSFSYVTIMSVDDDPSSTGSYRITITPDGAVRLIGAGVGLLFSTENGYIQIGQTYTFEVKREYDGTFWTYVNGVLAPASIGTNPVTNNTYKIGNNVVMFSHQDEEFSNLEKYHLP